jgi:cell division septal protein FtsQ
VRPFLHPYGVCITAAGDPRWVRCGGGCWSCWSWWRWVRRVGWLYGTQVLAVRQVEVTGSVLVPPEQVQAVAAVVLGTPLARVDTAAVAARVRSLPSVAAVDVSRSWPHTLVIEVTERTRSRWCRCRTGSP